MECSIKQGDIILNGWYSLLTYILFQTLMEYRIHEINWYMYYNATIL